MAAKSGSGGSPCAFNRPQRAAAVEPERAEGVGLSETLERTPAEPARRHSASGSR